MFEDKEWLTVVEASVEAAVSESKVVRWCRTGLLRHRKDGPHNGAIRIRRSDLEEFLASLTVHSAPRS